MQAENAALQGLVVELAANKEAAAQRLAALKERYQQIIAQVMPLPSRCMALVMDKVQHSTAMRRTAA